MKTAYSGFVSDTGAETCLRQTLIEARALGDKWPDAAVPEALRH